MSLELFPQSRELTARREASLAYMPQRPEQAGLRIRLGINEDSPVVTTSVLSAVDASESRPQGSVSFAELA